MIDLVKKIDEENEVIEEEDEPLFEDEEDFEEMIQEQERRRHLKENELDSKKESSTYQLIYASKLEEGEQPLGRVIGHENQKKELLSVIEWFKHSKELKEKGVSIPKGVILFGEPGNGKSLLIKEIIRCCEAPVFVFQGEQINVVEGICETFKKAREAGHAIIVFDELDLLINKERRVVRALQENLDGVESSDDILVLAATNYMREIPDPLLRHGRLEKLIKIPYPTGEEALELLKKHFKEFKLEFPKDFDDEEVALSLNGISCAGVKAVVNDLVLRNGFENITSEMIDNSIYNITDRVKDTPEEDNLEVAIHEAGHAVVAKAFPQFFLINRLKLIDRLIYDKKLKKSDKEDTYIALRICDICGKDFDNWDLQENHHHTYNFGFGSKHDLEYLEFDVCADCFDKIIDTILPLFPKSPLKDMECYQDKPLDPLYTQKVEHHDKDPY